MALAQIAEKGDAGAIAALTECLEDAAVRSLLREEAGKALAEIAA